MSERSQATTTKGHSASASSASQPFLFAQNHSLIRTGTAGGYSWHSFDRLDCVQTYNLDDLFAHARFHTLSRKKYSAEVICSVNLDRGRHAIAWVNCLIQKSRMTQSCPLSYTADIVIGAFEEGLVPFLCSLENRPDGVVLGSFQRDGKEWKLPLFILEVHSSPYKNTVSQTAADVIDQLRLLRCFNANITECVGFAFPKYPDSGHNRTCVTKVTVSFKKFMFVVQLNPLEIHRVETEIVRALESALTFRADYYPIFSFIRFSPDDIVEAVRSLRSRYKLRVVDVQQHATKHSMLLKSDHTFWKFIPRTTEASHIVNLHTALNDLHVPPIHVTLYRRLDYIGHSSFFAFPAHLPPLTKGEVKECLRDFMMMTATALEELHNFGFSHLDVRIPNSCFSQNDGEYIVKLIDLDRSMRDTVVSVSSYKGEMYKPQDGWTTSRCDWKQLGLLAAEIILGIHDHTTIVEGEGVDQDDCLRKLIRQGRWDLSACMKSSNVEIYQTVPLQDILDER